MSLAEQRSTGQGDPYAAIADACRHLAENPRDAAVRGQLAEAYLAVGVPEMALEHLYAIKQMHPELTDLDQAISQVASQKASRVASEQLESQLAVNLAVCRNRWVDRGDLWDRVRLPDGLEVFRCADGNLQARIVRDRAVAAMFAFADHRRSANAAQLPPGVSHTLHNGFLVCSLGLGESVVWLFDQTRDGLNGLAQTIILVEPELENLAINLAIRDWSEILQAPRVRLFAGADYQQQIVDRFRVDDTLPIPSYSVAPPAWSHHQPMDSSAVFGAMASTRHDVTKPLVEQASELYADRDEAYWADRFTAAGQGDAPPLRVMGIASLMTTVLQYSMRDWLAAFEQLGCQTHLLIEADYHLTLTPASYMQAILDFEPDLVVIHDHLRFEYAPWFPEGVPMLSWVQDRMPNLFQTGAGDKVGPLDFVTGIGKYECVERYGYPFERYLPVTHLSSERTYFPAVHTDSSDDATACEVSYVSHAGATVEALKAQAVNDVEDPRARQVIAAVADEVVDRAAQGRFVFLRCELNEMLRVHEQRTGVRLDAAHGRDGVLSFLLLKFASPLLRQTVAGWLADAGVDLHLYGQGWESNPRFARYARGVAGNGEHLRRIYHNSKINMQIQPTGAIHSRLLDGLLAGAFFLIHRCPNDALGMPMQSVHDYVQANGISRERDLIECDDPQMRQWLSDICSLTGWRLDDPELGLLTTLRVAAENDFLYYAGTVIPGYDQVSFSTKDELLERVEYFLSHADARRELAGAMRGPVVEHLSYRRGTQRMLNFVTDRLVRSVVKGSEVAVTA